MMSADGKMADQITIGEAGFPCQRRLPEKIGYMGLKN